MRYIPTIDVDRAKLRTTLTYRFTPSLTLGVEYNPFADEIGPLANWRALDETETRPALILGTSSDRIGTPHGRSYYATFSKNLEEEIGLPLAPYAGAAYGTFDDRLRPIGGVNVRWSEEISSTHLYDGQKVHHLLHYTFGGRHTIGLLLVDHRDVGISYSIGFDF
ncbi:MAG TPA: hypothetical protein VFI25_12115 [Planctomycetota bacterium]|nr:hypothetical protein [Planctomycetota bacterium]